MADGSVVIDVILNTSKAENQLSRLKQKIASLEDELTKSKSERTGLENKLNELTGQLDEAKAKLYEMQNAQQGAFSTEQISEQTETVNVLQKMWNEAQNNLERYNNQSSSAEKNLEELKGEAVTASRELAQASSMQPLLKSLEGIEKSVKKMGQRITSMLRRAFVFPVLYSALRSAKNWLWQVIQQNDEAVAALGRLKGALLVLAQPLVNVVIPAFTALVDILAKVATVGASLVSNLFGWDINETADAAKKLYKESNAIEAVGEAAEEAAGSLAGFDEINTIQTKNMGGGSSSKGSTIEPNFDLFDTSKYKSKIDELAVILGGALLVLGAILTFSGANIPLGIGMMALGAAMLYTEAQLNWGDPGLQAAINGVLIGTGLFLFVIGAILAFSGVHVPLGIGMMAVGALELYAAASLNWGALSEPVQEAISGFLVLAGMVALVIGLCLALSGVNIPVGIGLIAVGAASLAAAAALNWDSLGDTIYEKLANIGVIIGPVIAVVGIFLLIVGNFPLGLGMLIAGVAIFGVSEAVLNWDLLGDTVKEKLGNIVTIVGGVILAIGVILMLTGVAFAVGLAMVIAGISLIFGGSVTAQWDSVPNTVSEKLGLILRVLGGSLLVLGVILMLTGVGIPIGLGLILAGVGALGVSAIAVNWDFIVDKVKSIWASVKEYWNNHIAKYFTLDYWKGKASDIISGLATGIKSGLSTIKNAVSDLISNAWNSVTSFFTGGSDKKSSAKAPVQASAARIYSADVPALARGAVIPPNREFMAVLGDNKRETEVVSPLSTMKQAMLEALKEAGGAGGEINITVESVLDGKVVARNTVKHINAMTQQAGKPVLLI